MNCQDIDESLALLKVNVRRQIRGKNDAMNKIHSDHLKAVDNALMDVRIYVAKLSTGYTTAEALKMIDEFIYQKQIKF